ACRRIGWCGRLLARGGGGWLDCATFETPDSRETRWQRKDYLLICAGADRMYGWIKDTDPPEAADDRDEITEGTAVCDDLTNFGN
ncbi:MAG: hypothetical protein R6X20_10155, partial [Phycisphaerae bacterium]